MSSRSHRGPLRQLGSSHATGILVEATPSPSPVPEDQRGTRARSKPKRPVVNFADQPKLARRDKSKEGKRQKRAVDETLVSGYDMAPQPKKTRPRTTDPGPSQSTLTSFVTRTQDSGPSNRSGDRGHVRDQRAHTRQPLLARKPVPRPPAGTGPNDVISIVSDSDEEDSNLTQRFLKRPASKDRSHKANTPNNHSLTKGRGQTSPVPSQSSAQRPRSPATPRVRNRAKELDVEELLPGSQEEWDAAVQRRASASPVKTRTTAMTQSPQAASSSRVLVAQTLSQRTFSHTTAAPRSPLPNGVLVPETVLSPPVDQVYVPETVAPMQSHDEENPFHESSAAMPQSRFRLFQQPPSPESTEERQPGVVEGSIGEAFTVAPPRTARPWDRGSTAAGPSTRRSATPANAPQRVSQSKLRDSASKRAAGNPSSVTFGDEVPTPQKSHLLADFGRSPTKSPMKPPPVILEHTVESPPQKASVGMRNRPAFANDDDESYRPAPRGKASHQPKNLAPAPASRPQRVRSNPGQYRLPPVDTPIHQWPTTKGTSEATTSRKKRKSEALEERRPFAENPPSTPREERVERPARMSSPLTPPPETQAPLPLKSASQRSVLDETTPSRQNQHLEPYQSPSIPHRRLSQVSQEQSPRASPSQLSPRTPLQRGGTPADPPSDFWDKYAEFSGTPPPEESQVPSTPSRKPASPLVRRVSLSPRNSQRSVGAHQQPTPQRPSTLRTVQGPHSSPQDLAARLLAQAQEDARRKREQQDEEEREREERNREMAALLEADEEDEDEVLADLSKALSSRNTASPSKTSPPVERRRSSRVVPSKPMPVPALAPVVPRKKQPSEASKKFERLMEHRQTAMEQRDQWDLAMSHIAASREESAESEIPDNALGLESTGEIDHDLVSQARENEENDRYDERARQLETMMIFWENDEDIREPRTEDDFVEPIENADIPDEVWQLVTDASGQMLSLLSSGLLSSLRDEAAPAVAMWLFKLALTAENDLALVAAQQLLELVAADDLRDNPFGDSTRACQYIEAIFASLGAAGVAGDDLPTVDVRVGRQAACTFVCELASTLATAGWLLPLEAERLLGRLIELRIDPTTTHSLAIAIAAATEVLLTVSLQASTLPRLATAITKDLGTLSLYHQSVAVLALGQGTTDIRTFVRLLASELLLPRCLEYLPENTTGPSEAILNDVLERLMKMLMQKPAEWVDIAATVTLYVAAASDSAQFARPSRNKEMGKHCPFQSMLAQAQQRITKIEHHQPRAMIVKSRLAAIETSSLYAAQLAWHLKEKDRLGSNGLEVGVKGQARLSLGAAAR